MARAKEIGLKGRFDIHPESNQWIIDMDTGKKYSSIDAKELLPLLNNLSNKNNLLDEGLKECELTKNIMKERLVNYYDLCEKHNVYSAKELDNLITSILNEHDRSNKTIRIQTMALCDFHNRELAESKWGDKRPEFNLDKYYEVCMEDLKEIIYKEDFRNLINDLIYECETGIEETINGDKDSYIVKHDIAIKMLKKLADELEVKL